MTDPIATDLLPEFEARGRALANIARVLDIPECSPAALAARVQTGFADLQCAIAKCHDLLDRRKVPGTGTKSLLERIELLADAKADVVSDLKDANVALDAVSAAISVLNLGTGDIVERVKVLVANAKRDESMVDGVFRVLRESGQEGPHVVTMARALVAERDALRGQASHILESRGRFADKIQECIQLLLAAGVNEGGVAQGIATLIERLQSAERNRDALLHSIDALKASGSQDHSVASDVVLGLRDVLGHSHKTEDLVGVVRNIHESNIGFHRVIRELAAALRKASPTRGSLLEQVEALIGERDAARCNANLAKANADAFKAERDDLRATLAKCHTACDGVGIAIRTDVSERVYHMAAELASLREKVQATKPTGPAWDDEYLTIDGVRTFWTFALVAPKGVFGVVRVRDNKYVGYANSLDSARRLAEILAGFDPGGVWRVAGDPVTVAVVRAVCPNTPVAWSAA